jgi:hypothetical protein
MIDLLSSLSTFRNDAFCKSDGTYRCDMAHIHHSCLSFDIQRIRRNVFVSSALPMKEISGFNNYINMSIQLTLTDFSPVLE